MHSNLIRTPSALVVFLVLVTAMPGAAQDKSMAQGQRRVMRFVTFQHDTQWWLVATPPEGGAAVKLMMTDEVKNAARGPTPGSRLVWVTTKPGVRALPMATEVSPFDGPRELESPTAYVFEGTAQEKVGVATTTVAKFSKFGMTRSVLLPTRPGPGGRAGPDPSMLEKLKSFNAGDVVEVEVQQKGNSFTLLDIDKYRQPRVAEFVKPGPVSANGKSVPGVTLLADDAQVQLALPAGPKAAALNAAVRRFKPGMFVRYTARDEEQPPVLREIRPDVEVRPTASGQLEIVATFCRVSLSSYSASTYCYVYPESQRPEDKTLIAGCRRLSYDVREQAKVGLSAADALLMKAVLEPPRTNAAEDTKLTPRERAEYGQLYRAWLQTSDEAERARVEEMMLVGAMELSQRFRKDADFQVVTLRGMLKPEQLKAAIKLGEDALSRRAN